MISHAQQPAQGLLSAAISPAWPGGRAVNRSHRADTGRNNDIHLQADLVLVLHAAFIAFVVAGGLLVLHFHRLAWLHLPCAAWGILVELFGWTCPLTPLENRLRHRDAGLDYETGFIEHYLAPLIYPAGLTEDIQYLLALFVLLVNAGIYTIFWKRRRSAAA